MLMHLLPYIYAYTYCMHFITYIYTCIHIQVQMWNITKCYVLGQFEQVYLKIETLAFWDLHSGKSLPNED